MASLKCSPLLLVLSLLLLVTFSDMAEAYGSRFRPSDCKPRCTYRCSATSHKKPCMFFCLKCCSKCLCVPPGVYGNKQVCPCYNNWKTKEGKPKCP
ncbi:protein RSI-1 [Ricinus communis]|uniref:RSI-1 protein, putative n=1 Tax=Ricinus communis TaxID=3988 RepID=B9SYW6_RICCO|nr:protein RSI-1 [Ricinus communis]EEF31200.1 RSI-1 protein precursor, putative [Ricinus communis]|eukprot:XP_002531185.1 protein RSI-1 [Ricinus communis]